MATRIRLNKQIEMSQNPGYIVVTDSLNEPNYVAPGSNGQVLTIVSGVPAYADPATITMGPILTAGNSQAGTIASSELRLAPVTGTTPGIIDGNDQILYVGKKTARKSQSGAVTTPLAARNELVANDDDGVQITLEGANGFVLGAVGSVVVGGSPTGGTKAFLAHTMNGVQYESFQAMGPSNTAKTNGFKGVDVLPVGASLNVSASLASRKGLFVFSDPGSTLTLPDPATVDEGTYCEWLNINTSGAACVITTSAVSPGIWDGANNVPVASVSVLTGSTLMGRLYRVNTLTGPYWLMSVTPSSVTGAPKEISTYSAGGGCIVTATGPGITFTRTTASQWDVVVPAGVDLLSLDINSNSSQSATASLEIFVTWQGTRPFNQDTSANMTDAKVPIITTLRKLNPSTYPTTAAGNNAAWNALVTVAGKLRLATAEFTEVGNGGANHTTVKMVF
jgi:hypothetical protein